MTISDKLQAEIKYIEKSLQIVLEHHQDNLKDLAKSATQAASAPFLTDMSCDPMPTWVRMNYTQVTESAEKIKALRETLRLLQAINRTGDKHPMPTQAGIGLDSD